MNARRGLSLAAALLAAASCASPSPIPPAETRYAAEKLAAAAALPDRGASTVSLHLPATHPALGDQQSKARLRASRRPCLQWRTQRGWGRHRGAG